MLVTAPVALLTLFLITFKGHPSANQINFAKIQLGMSAKEVDAIFGCSSGDYTTKSWKRGTWDWDPPMAPGKVDISDHPSRCALWYFDEGLAAVYFGANGRTTGKEWFTRKPQGWIEDIRDFLRSISR
jgi:hypothetical protein